MSDASFALTPEYQNRVLNYMLKNSMFCDMAKDHLSPELFATKQQQFIFGLLTKGPLHQTPITLQEELITAAQKGHLKQSEVGLYLDLYKEVTTQMLPDEQEHIRSNFSTFVRTQNVKRAILESAQLIQDGKWELIERKIAEAVATGTDLSNLGHRYFEDYKDRLQRRITYEAGVKLPVGIPELDFEYLKGGLENQQLGLVVGASGRGKSIFLSHIAKTTVLLGKKAVYYTLELSEDVIASRFDSTFCQIRPHELRDKYQDSYDKLTMLSSKYKDVLTVKQFPAQKASVNTLIAHYRMLCETGFVPDVVIVDYLDLLRSDRTYSEMRFELDYITQCLRGFAQEYDTRVWTATQLNRSGYGAETPDASHISEGFSKLFTVDVALIMAQSKEEQEDEILRIRVEKNRNGPMGRTVEITTDYGFMTFYRDTLNKEAPNAANGGAM